jgi:hypothetical protein
VFIRVHFPGTLDKGENIMKPSKFLIPASLAIALISTSAMVSAAGILGRALHRLETGKKDNGPPGGSVKVSKAENFKGVTQVVIGQFTVGYFVKNVNYGGNSLFSSASGVKTVGDLSGVDAATFQATTDAAFEDFKKQLAAHGITVVEPTAYLNNQYRVKATPEEQGVGAKVQLDESDHAEATLYWPSQMGRRDNAMTTTGLGMMNMKGAQSMSWTLMGEKDFAKTTGIPVLNVQLLIDFAGPLKVAKGASDLYMKSAARIAISNYGSQVSMIRGTDGVMSGGGKIILQSPIVQEGNFADFSGKDTNKAGRIIGGLAGLNVQSKAKFHFEVTDPAAYQTTVLGATSKAADLFIGQMQTLR